MSILWRFAKKWNKGGCKWERNDVWVGEDWFENVRAEFLSLGTVDVWAGWFFVVRMVPCVVGCLAASVVSTH